MKNNQPSNTNFHFSYTVVTITSYPPIQNLCPVATRQRVDCILSPTQSFNLANHVCFTANWPTLRSCRPTPGPRSRIHSTVKATTLSIGRLDLEITLIQLRKKLSASSFSAQTLIAFTVSFHPNRCVFSRISAKSISKLSDFVFLCCIICQIFALKFRCCRTHFETTHLCR